MNFRSILTCLALLTYALESYAQNAKEVRVFQWEGADSTNGYFSKKLILNNLGQIIKEELCDFKTHKKSAKKNGVTYYKYKDTLLIKELTIFEDDTKLKKRYKYNSKNQLVSEKAFHYDYRLKKKPKDEDCILIDEDFKRKRNWEILNEIFFEYDSMGRLVKYSAPNYHHNNQNIYLWHYDSLGNLIEKHSYDSDRLVWIKYYEQLGNGYNYYINWDEKYQIQNVNDWPKKYSVRYEYDNDGNLVEFTKPQEAGIPGNYILTNIYDDKGQLLKTTRTDSHRHLEISHLYFYD